MPTVSPPQPSGGAAPGTRRMASPPPPPSGALPASARQEKPVADARVLSFSDIHPGFEPRDGDVLVVSYGEVTIPMPKPYSNVKVGGGIYTRRLLEGDNAVEQYERVYKYLKAVSERTAQDKVETWSKELKG